MNAISYCRLCCVVSLATVTVLASGAKAGSETITPTRFTQVPTPGTTATRAAGLSDQLASTSVTSTSSEVAQATQPPPSTPDSTTPDPTAPTEAVSFTDVDPNYWAYPFIQALTSANAIAGFPDGTFRPEQPVSRAEFAAMIQKAVNPNPVRQLSPGGFADVPTDYWAATAIATAYEGRFMDGYPDNTFQPDREIPKAQAITALANGLKLTPSEEATNIVNTYYTDATQIPTYALAPIAAATQANVVVNYPDVKTLNPQAPLTRAEAAAHLYQALVRLGKTQPLPVNVAAANYIVGGPGAVSQTPPTPTTPEETAPTETTAPTPDVQPGRATRGVSSYLGVAANFGLTGDSALGDGTNVAVFSKIGLLNYLSVRPTVVIIDDPAILIPITYDFNLQRAEALDETFSIVPYAGAGIGIKTGEDSSVGFLLTGGLDVPLGSQ
ncbi:S-layer homology domain-containing protein, partial [Chroococcidiopsidales cyanobacterium LEGE 13417]|nr:S-layer homology domain-containing protein [Chroococcidiopsidales cyanobacterium LEGE 13417]